MTIERIFKGIIILGVLCFHASLDAACSSISRTNYSANQVLTSTQLNSDFNTVYNFTNSYDGECIQSSTVPITAADSTWDNLKNYLQAGCKVTYSDASTLSISKCYLAVDGEFVGKSTATSVAFGCTNCSSETNSTAYYVYVADGSTGSTLTPLILTTAPNEDGYDASNNKVLARFYNNSTGDIDQYSIDQWSVNGFIPQDTGWINGGTQDIEAVTTAPTKGTVVVDNVKYRRVNGNVEVIYNYQQTLSGGAAGSGVYLFPLPNNLTMDTGIITASTTVTVDESDGVNILGQGEVHQATAWSGSLYVYAYDSTRVYFKTGTIQDYSTTTTNALAGNPIQSGSLDLSLNISYTVKYSVPVNEWGY